MSALPETSGKKHGSLLHNHFHHILILLTTSYLSYVCVHRFYSFFTDAERLLATTYGNEVEI
jgi:hypothetical protein